ncbi:MAG: aldolase/citrate lyase family protein [Pseudomonadota bacterium]
MPESQKERARGLIQEGRCQGLARRRRRHGADQPAVAPDPARSRGGGVAEVSALLLPKIASADHVKLIVEVIADLEAERGMVVGTTQLIPMIETADAFFKIHEIARADPASWR